MVLDACRIKRFGNIYSEEETLMMHHWLEQNVHLRGLSEKSLFCIFMIFEDVLLMP